MREEDDIQLWVLTTAMQGPTLQSLDALRHFLIRTIPGLTGSKLDSLNLETASWEDISSQDQFIEGIMLAHQEQAGLFNPFSQQGRERWYEQFMDPETSLHEEISNLVESPDTLPHRFNVLQDAVKALKTDHAYSMHNKTLVASSLRRKPCTTPTIPCFLKSRGCCIHKTMRAKHMSVPCFDMPSLTTPLIQRTVTTCKNRWATPCFFRLQRQIDSR